MQRKTLFGILLLALLSFSHSSYSAAATLKNKEADYVAIFNYAPDSQGTPGLAGVTFAVGNVVYRVDRQMPWPTFPQFANLGKAIKEDLTELLVAKGFTVRGPFDSYDVIPYSDKKAIDLWLAPTMELSVELKDRKEEVESIWAAPPISNLTGNAVVSGKIVLELREVVTNELMWSKSIPFTDTFPYSLRVSEYVSGRYIESEGGPNRAPFDYAYIMNGVVRAVEKQYPELMVTIFKLIDPEEMRVIKKECLELKSKKGY